MRTKGISLASFKNPNYWNILILFAGFWLSFNYITNIDVQWLTHESQLLFSGGHYITDFVDPNPPLVLCLYKPIQWLHHLIPALSLQASSSLYFYLLISLSMARSQQLLNSKPSIPLFMGPLLALLLAIFPMNDQGEREVLMLILSMPYFIHCLTRRESTKRNYIDTFFAAIGFLLKMQYLIIPLLVEIFLWIKKDKEIKHTCIILGLSVFYIASILAFTPNYWKQIIPLVQHQYALYFAYTPWPLFIAEPSTGGCLLSILCCSLASCRIRSRTQSLLLLATIASFVIYIIPQQRFLYHDIPAISFLSLLSAYLLYRISAQKGGWLSMKLISLSLLFSTLSLFAIIGSHMQRSISEARYAEQSLTQISFQKADRIMPLFITSTRTVLSTLARNKTSCSRFSGLWMITHFITQPESITENDRVMQHQIQGWVSEDIERCQPNVILLGNEPDIIGPTLDFFTESPRFQNIWRHYRLTHVIGTINYYEKQNPNYQANDASLAGTKSRLL